ncbi:MAG TPA: YdeI/OmpD-associated family protein [Jatrophihabitans sp.]
MARTDGLPELLVPALEQWREWLAENHADSPGVWLVLAKKGGTTTTLTYDQALDEALCVGWIDGQVGRRDEGSYRQRWTPRRATSPWSARNVEHIARLTADGRMQPAGVAAVEAAKADGRWEVAYAGPATAEEPADLLAAVAKEPKAQAMYDVLTKGNRYSLIYRVNEAKRAETRARRIEQFVAMLAKGETFHPQRKRPE